MGITTAGKSEVAKLIGNTGSPSAFTYLANGSGSTAFAAGQTALVTENTTNGAERAAATVSESSGVLTLTKQWTATGAVTIKEAGSFNASSGGDMLHREVLDATVTLANTDTYTYTVEITVS